MGRLAAIGMREHARDARDAIAWHLQYNHYPPIPGAMVDVAVIAVGHARQGEYDVHVNLPGGVTWRGQETAPVSAIVSEFHLDAFIED